MEIVLSERHNTEKADTENCPENENKGPKESKIGGWIFFLIVGAIMIYSASADEMNMAMNNLFQKIIGVSALAFIAYLIIRKLTKR